MDAKWIQRATFLLIVVLVLYLNYRVFQPFFVPIAWAAVMAVFFFPVHRRVQDKIHNPNTASGVSLLMVMLVLVAPAVTVGAACVQQGLHLFRSLPREDILPKLQEYVNWISGKVPFPLPELQDKLIDAAQSAGTFLATHSAAAAGGAANFFMEIAIMLVVLFFLFRDGESIVTFFRDTSPLDNHTSDRVFEEISNLVTVTLQSTIVVAIAQGTATGLVFWVLGIPAPVFWGVVGAVLSFLPLVGPTVLWVGAAVVLLASGEYWRAGAMTLLGGVVISNIDNVLRPILISGRAQLNAVMSILSVLGGIYAFGFLGMVLGPLVVAIAIGMLQGYRKDLKPEPAE